MSLVDAKTWVEQNFHPDSRPDLRTVRGWVKDGHVPGRVIGPKRVYIDADAWGRTRTGNDLADKVLQRKQ